MRNNINIAGLSEFVHEVKENNNQAEIRYGVNIDWISGVKTCASTQNIKLGDQKLVRDFNFEIDEPQQLLGLNSNPTPQEYLMAGIAGCMAVTFVAGASLMKITLDKLTLKLSGSIDLSGFLGIENSENIGFKGFNCDFIVEGDGTIEQYNLLLESVKKHSPNYATAINPIEFKTQIIQQ